ncbi:MAG: protein NO VEIN domain-containing protein, partial [Planctomycetota bacterium]
LDDEVRDQLVDEYTAALELEQLRAEIAALKELVEQAPRVRELANDSKLAALKKCLGEAQFVELKDGRGKLLLFTEHRATLGYVREHLERWGFTTCGIHGGMNPHERKRAQEQFRTAAQEVGLRVEPRADGLWRIEHVPADLRSDRLRSVHRLGKADASYRKVTFHKHHLEQSGHVDAVLMGPGHPLYAALDENLNEKLADLQGRVGFYVDPLTTEPYRLHFFEIAIRGKDSRGSDVLLHGELVAVREQRGQFEIVPSDILFNLPSQSTPPAAVDPVDTQAASDYLKSTYQLECRARCQEERQHFARICREYSERCFDARIKRAQERAMLLAAEATGRPEYKLSADEARKYVDELQRPREERLEGLSRLGIARTGPVRHLATAIVLAAGAEAESQLADLADELDPNIRRKSELAAEDMVVVALKEEGFPEDRIECVGHLKLGFDLRAQRIVDEATGDVLVKRVEVKGRMRGQPVRLTTNEWYKAQQLAETYWLYVVWDPLGKSPELVRIQNPAVRLDHAKREIVAARFFEIPAETVMAVGRQSEADA